MNACRLTDERWGLGKTIASCGSSREAISLMPATSITASMETLCSTRVSTSSIRRTATASVGSREKPVGAFEIARICPTKGITTGVSSTIGGRCTEYHEREEKRNVFLKPGKHSSFTLFTLTDRQPCNQAISQVPIDCCTVHCWCRSASAHKAGWIEGKPELLWPAVTVSNHAAFWCVPGWFHYPDPRLRQTTQRPCLDLLHAKRHRDWE